MLEPEKLTRVGTLEVPIWLFTQESVEVPVEEEEATSPAEENATEPVTSENPEVTDSEEAVLEDVSDSGSEDDQPKTPKTETIITDKWVQLNAHAPIWMRYIHLFI